MSAETTHMRRSALRPTIRKWINSLVAAAATLITATIAGVLFPFGTIDSMPEETRSPLPELADFVTTLPERYVGLIATALNSLAGPGQLFDGFSFSLSLLFF